MGNITVAVLGALGYGGSIGKKGTSTDITFYNLKKGEDTVTLIEPTRYPERLAPLFYAVSLSKKAISCGGPVRRYLRRMPRHAAMLRHQKRLLHPEKLHS